MLSIVSIVSIVSSIVSIVIIVVPTTGCVHRFVNCVERPTPLSKDEHEGRVTVDYSLFDKIVPCEDVPVGADVGKGEIVSHV